MYFSVLAQMLDYQMAYHRHAGGIPTDQPRYI